MKTLRDYQLKVLNWSVYRSKVAFFMEMRLGKTLVAIKWAKNHLAKHTDNLPDRVLIIGKKAFIENWRNELLDEGYLRQQIVMLTGSFDEKIDTLKHSNAVFFITNYEAIVSCNEILKYEWKIIIADESTQIKNPKAKITTYLTKMTGNVPYKAILSGLPSPESIMDYFSQFTFLFGHFMGYDNFWHWRYRFFFQAGLYGWEPKLGTIQRIQKELQLKAYELKRFQVGAAEEKIYKRVYVDMTDIQRKIYQDVVDDFQYEYGEEKKDTKWILVRLEWMARIAGGFTSEGNNLSDNKLNEIIELLKTELRNEKVIIYFKYNHEVDYIFRHIKKQGISCGKFTGEEKVGFTFDNKLAHGVKVACVQQKCARYGLDWSNSSTVIYYSNWYEHEVRAQTEDRIVSVTKKDPLLYFDMVTRNSIDEHILDLLNDKKAQSSTLNMEILISKIIQKEKLENAKRT